MELAYLLLHLCCCNSRINFDWASDMAHNITENKRGIEMEHPGTEFTDNQCMEFNTSLKYAIKHL